MKKQILAASAANLYIEKFMTLENIAKNLNVSERTLRRWKSSDNWDEKRKEYMRSNTTLHEDLYNFGKSLLKSIKTDIENGEKIQPSKLYTATNIINMLKNIKTYEDKITNNKQNSEKPKSEGLSAEIIRQIEKNILGITYED